MSGVVIVEERGPITLPRMCVPGKNDASPNTKGGNTDDFNRRRETSRAIHGRRRRGCGCRP
jgi:hypothetical protein